MNKLPLRSILFVPGDSEKKMEKTVDTSADALVFDLEDSVAPPRKPVAREMVARHIKTAKFRKGLDLWVRINPLDTEYALADVAAVVGARPAGILLPKVSGPEDVRTLSNYLDVMEVREGVEPGSILIMCVATETAGSIFSLGGYSRAGLERLYGLTWGAEDLSADLGASTNKGEDGKLALTYMMAKSQMLLAAKAAGVYAIDTAYPDFRNIDVLSASLNASRREGFNGGFAIHPAQVEPLNQAFSPSADDIALAEKVVGAFDADPSVGTIGIDGKMYDRPHLIQARKVLAMRDAFANR